MIDNTDLNEILRKATKPKGPPNEIIPSPVPVKPAFVFAVIVIIGFIAGVALGIDIGVNL